MGAATSYYGPEHALNHGSYIVYNFYPKNGAIKINRHSYWETLNMQHIRRYFPS
jgi:hypothetical protein